MKNIYTKGSIVASILILGALAIGAVGFIGQNKVIERQQKVLEELQSRPQISKEEVNDAVLGAFRPSGYVGKLLTRLNEGGSETTFNTTPGIAPDGSSITTAKIGDFIVLTINPGAANEEKISASAVSVSGTTATWTIVNRGLSFTANTSVTANKKQHSIGETVIISNDDQFLSVQYAAKDVDETITGSWSFPTPTSALHPATKAYADSIVSGGTVTTNKITVAAIAGENMATGTVMYFKRSDARWYKADTDVEESVEYPIIGIAQGAGTTGNSINGGVLMYGLDNTQIGLTAGANYFLSATAGATSTATTTVGIGKAKSTTELYVNPNFYGPGLQTDNTYTGSNVFSGAASFSSTVTLTGSATSNIGTASSTQFTSSFTWGKPSTLKYLIVELVAGGGGGGGANADGETGGGGGGGGYCRNIILAASLGSTETVTVGAGGTAGPASGAGGTGGTTSFGSHCSATGGAGGSTSASGGLESAGGVGGIGSLGNIKLEGADGNSGLGDPTSDYTIGGGGGDSVFGGGGRGGVLDAAGSSGNLYGGGGGGAAEDDSTGQAGGAGGAGVVVLTEIFY